MRKLISLALTLTLVSSLSIPALAIDSSGSSGNSEAVITQDSSTFSVTAPTGLPVAVDKDGVITVADNAKIINNSYGPVKVRNVSVTPLNSWSIVDYDKDFSKEKIGLKAFGFILNGDEVTIDGNLELTESSWSTISGKSELGLSYNANLGVQKVSQNIDIANVVFTVGWDLSVSDVPSIPDSKYVLAQDSDFSGETDGTFKYTGTDDYVEVPHVIKGVPVTSYYDMFRGTSVKGVKSTNTNVTSMGGMFCYSVANSLDVSNLETSKVTFTADMFARSAATNINFGSNFNTSNVTKMYGMFQNSQATTLDLSNFTTSNVTDMDSMFESSQATTLDLSSFDTSKVTKMFNMLRYSPATIGYAKTQSDANRLNATTTHKPVFLTFVIKDSEPEESEFKYVLAQDSDFSGTTDSNFKYIGTDKYVEVPHVIKGIPVTSYHKMFYKTSVAGVKSTNSNIINMSSMFYNSEATTLDLSNLDTSNVISVWGMFSNSQATTGYARTQEDADKFNMSIQKPDTLIFIVK